VSWGAAAGSGAGESSRVVHASYRAHTTLILARRHLHYLFYTSQTGIQTDPLILWFNGGPGCSSLEGAFQESGPLWTTSGGAGLQVNTYSYNNFSHQLFLEAPACVGFSYADASNPNGCTHNDTSTAADNLAALQVWFTGFHEFAPNDFWISGESYAGVYVPSLAYDVVNFNAAGGKINLKGIMVGNGCIGNAVGICGSSAYGEYLSVAQLHGHGFISDLSFNAMNAACGDYENPTAACSAAISTAGNEAGSNFDIYDIYSASYGVCNYGSRKGMPPSKRSSDATPTRPLTSSWSDRLHRMGNTCTNDDDLTTYLNTATVQTALHIPTQTTWNECGGVSYTSDIVDERTTIYPALQAAGLSILIYNGEADACV
jgi:serine carboxypeptidase-like clade 2